MIPEWNHPVQTCTDGRSDFLHQDEHGLGQLYSSIFVLVVSWMINSHCAREQELRSKEPAASWYSGAFSRLRSSLQTVP
jgi:hypothetical protein